jgi:hypothetical protein
MKLRHGIYTPYQGYELKLTETRVDFPIPDHERTFLLLWDETQKCPFSDFTKESHLEGYYKVIPGHEISEVFYIHTLGRYKNQAVEIFSSREDQLVVSTRNKSVAKELRLTKTGKNWYQRRVLFEEVEVIWEELTRLRNNSDILHQIAELKSIWTLRNRKEVEEKGKWFGLF